MVFVRYTGQSAVSVFLRYSGRSLLYLCHDVYWAVHGVCPVYWTVSCLFFRYSGRSLCICVMMYTGQSMVFVRYTGQSAVSVFFRYSGWSDGTVHRSQPVVGGRAARVAVQLVLSGCTCFLLHKTSPHHSKQLSRPTGTGLGCSLSQRQTDMNMICPRHTYKVILMNDLSVAYR